MSEGITVAIRLGEGRDRVVSRYRDLYRIPAFLQHPGFVEGDLTYIRNYAMEESPFEGRKDGGPQDVGIVAIDLPSRQILMYEDRGLDACSPERIVDASKGVGPSPSAWETREIWRTLMAAGRVSLRVQWRKQFEADLEAGTFGEAADRFVLGVGPFPGPNERSLSLYELPYSLEPLKDLDAAAARIQELQGYDRRPREGLRPYPQRVEIDLSPWTITRFRLTRDGDERLRRRMASLGFPGCAPRDPGWQRWAKDVTGVRDWAELAYRRRMKARARLVASPF